MARIVFLVCIVIAVAACDSRKSQNPEALGPGNAAGKRAAWIDETRLAKADQEPQNWYLTNRGINEDHYSPLTKINEDTAASLGFAWEYQLHTSRGLEASPVVIDGVMYTSGNWGKVYAVDAKTGRELWTYDPKVPGEWGRRACCDVVNRGVAVWKGRIYVGSLDGYVIALDAATGKEVWRSDALVDRKRYQTSTGAPKIAGGKVVIGNSGADMGSRGYVTAFDADTGKFAWRFFIVPGDPKQPPENPELDMASKTWDPNSRWDVGGGGNAWDAMAYDPELNLLYVGTGNGGPDPVWSRSPKGGDNLFLVSILAINPDTGRLAWYYQEVPHDSYDYTATAHMILAELPMGGRSRKVIMQAPKDGFFYILDRATGELLSAEKYGKVTWASHVDSKTGKPVFTEVSDYSKSPKLIYPGAGGAHNWQPMSFNPHTHLVYLNLLDQPYVYGYSPRPRYEAGADNQHLADVDFKDIPVAKGEVALSPEPVSYLQAWDPIAQQERSASGTGM